MFARIAFMAGLLVSLSISASAETVFVKYRGPVNLDSFACTDITDSSLVTRVCYNSQHSYMVIRLKQTYYHYCDIDAGTVDGLLAASSKGRYYRSKIKDSATGGRFGCRYKTVPTIE